MGGIGRTSGCEIWFWNQVIPGIGWGWNIRHLQLVWNCQWNIAFSNVVAYQYKIFLLLAGGGGGFFCSTPSRSSSRSIRGYFYCVQHQAAAVVVFNTTLVLLSGKDNPLVCRSPPGAASTATYGSRIVCSFSRRSMRGTRMASRRERTSVYC